MHMQLSACHTCKSDDPNLQKSLPGEYGFVTRVATIQKVYIFITFREYTHTVFTIVQEAE